MIITMELLMSGASQRGSHKRQQIELLGEKWPPTRGWKQRVIGKIISDEIAEEFIRLGDGDFITESSVNNKSEYWFNSLLPVDIYMYVLELSNGCYYVGLTGNIKKRIDEHFNGKGAEWTRLNTPLRLMYTVNTGTKNAREAEIMESEATVILMLKYGISKVRGGYYTQTEQNLVEVQLRAHGVWERVKQSELEKKIFDYEHSWDAAMGNFLDVVLNHYDEGCPERMHEAVFETFFSLTRYPCWNESFAPCLSWSFWNKKGILPVLLSFKHARTVGSKLPSAYDVLAAALNRGKKDNHPLRRLFLLGWQAFKPPTTLKQAETVIRFMSYLDEDTEFDRQYDAFVSILFPEMRELLQQP
ncbi:GIY-YIG nuclease family protein [Kosakonia cowanii]|uniref:GIY-YIG nuclease family protein n=1 Tax=Kosakonia cowanii TaxID=208223 RepID=UPI0028AA2BC9|nr:GIY-YIG nuclease family protein [Kosakonia cowanii]